MFVGKKAAGACAKWVDFAPNLRLLESYHPSPIVRATAPEKWQGIPGEWAKAMEGL